MNLRQAQVLVTGGSEGIGFGLAKRFLASGSRVLVTGRSMEKLNSALTKLPGLEIFKNDIGDAKERETLAEYVKQVFPALNVIINNAGIQRRVDLASDHAPWSERQAEIEILFSAPIHLNHLLIPLILSNQKDGLIANVTSGGAYVPQAFAPVYSASKAALHSYTMNLRYSLSDTLCRVVEIVPPAVKTNLAGEGMNHGADIDEFCDAVFQKLIDGKSAEIGFGPTENLSVDLNGKPLRTIFEASASRFPVAKY